MSEDDGGPRYFVARGDSLRIVELDSFSAVYHCASGITHLITAPAPEIMAALAEAGLTRAALLAKLRADYALGDADGVDDDADGVDDSAALIARLDELVASGLVATA